MAANTCTSEEGERILNKLCVFRHRELAFSIGQLCVFASAMIAATLYALFLYLDFTSHETLEWVASSIAWKAAAHTAGWAAIIGFVLVLFGRGYRRVLLGALALLLGWLFVFPYGIKVR